MLGIFLDSETNGLNPKKHHIIELAYKIIDVESGEIKECYEAVLSHSLEEWKKSDPSSIHITGFTWEEIKKGKKKEEVKEEVIASFKRNKIKRGKAVFICQNPSFDRAFFSEILDPDLQEELNLPYHWLDLASMYWVKCLEKLSPPREHGLSKNEIAKAYRLKQEKMPHRAMNGVKHLVLCYEAVVGFPSKGEKDTSREWAQPK